MRDLICRISVWLRLVFAPGPGRRRRGAARQAVAVPVTPRPAAPSLPVHRSPYGLPERFDGATTAVRPYLIAHERRQQRLRQQQRRRRLTLVLAADFGVDLDTRVLHGAGAAR
ncbi:hypothetical protein I3F58_01200 [Streptomyces sp. MUM 203J]|uniref:hypothetical protein n=1 Tax=Streptomyces sp. MUM 203J TaxID=2791990 RepID=UPI001F047975|nr:hypothetical protein [Streptomyces sp. MUM 203J]MCH0538197.1 hypothetical protein [Streptomyces sp. MUM 203J]